MTKFLSLVKIDESSNFLNVVIKTITSFSIINKNVFEFSRFFSRNFIFNSRMMSFASFNSFHRSLYFSMNSFIFIIFLLYSLITKIFSSRMFIHVLIKAFSFFSINILIDYRFKRDKKFSHFLICFQKSQ
jgi:hypothetical protein